MWSSFGFIRLTNRDGGTRSVNIGAIDLERLSWQAMTEREDTDGSHINTDDSFCSSSFWVLEKPTAILKMIRKHDKDNSHMVRQYAQRNGFILVKGETW